MKYKSNVKQVLDKLKRTILSHQANDKMIGEIAQGIHASNLRRIHNDGKNVNLSRIGKYSTNPIYVNPKNSPKKFSPTGKAGKTKFKNGRSHKTKYFNTGYYGFRRTIGREYSKVNLQLTGSLRANYVVQHSGDMRYQIGFLSSAKADIAAKLEQHFGGVKIWGVSKNDRKLAEEIITKYLKKYA